MGKKIILNISSSPPPENWVRVYIISHESIYDKYTLDNFMVRSSEKDSTVIFLQLNLWLQDITLAEKECFFFIFGIFFGNHFWTSLSTLAFEDNWVWKFLLLYPWELIFLHEIVFGSSILPGYCSKHQNLNYECFSYPETENLDFGCFSQFWEFFSCLV